MPSYSTQAIILKRTNYSETDRIITAYSENKGKIRFLAKGIRRPLSKKAFALEPFTLVKLSLAIGKNLDIVTQALNVKSFRKTRECLTRSTQAFHCCELVFRLTPDDQPSKDIYLALKRALDQIEGGPKTFQNMTDFENHLLDLTGFGQSTKENTAHIESIIERPLLAKKLLIV